MKNLFVFRFHKGLPSSTQKLVPSVFAAIANLLVRSDFLISSGDLHHWQKPSLCQVPPTGSRTLAPLQLGSELGDDRCRCSHRKEIGVTPTQVALTWIADRPGVVAPIVGARTVEHLRNNLGAAELTLDNKATAALEKVSAPQSGGYPYGVFGAGQRGRWLQDGTPAPTQPYSAGSEHPTGRA
jgi:hypothetical protein